MQTTTPNTFDNIAYNSGTIPSGIILRLDNGKYVGGKVERTPACPGYAGSDYRLGLLGLEIGANVEITGRRVRLVDGGTCGVIRCKVTIPGDCEPDQEFRADLRVF